MPSLCRALKLGLSLQWACVGMCGVRSHQNYSRGSGLSWLQAQALDPGNNRKWSEVYSGLCLLQFSGKWYTKATVSDRNLTVGNNPKRTLPMMVSNMDGGDLYVKIKIWVTGYCYNIEVHLRKTNEPLKYTACECPADQGLLQGRVPAWRLPALLISHFGFPLPFHVGDIRVHG